MQTQLVLLVLLDLDNSQSLSHSINFQVSIEIFQACNNQWVPLSFFFSFLSPQNSFATYITLIIVSLSFIDKEDHFSNLLNKPNNF